MEEHSHHLKTVLQTLQDRRLYSKFSKCEFWLDRVAFLGHIVFQDGIEVGPSKVEAVRDWTVPKSMTEIRSFLGLTGYYRKFIQGFSSIVVPMTALTKKNAKFSWGPECQGSFDRLKQALTTAPVLAMPSEQGEFVVYTDASKLANVVADALSRKHAVIAHLSVQRPLQAEIQIFELAVYARGEAPNLATLTVQPTLRDRIRAGQTSDEQLQKWRQRDEAKGQRLYAVVEDIVRYRDPL
ncbi:uncharacterized mitochondrial protein AtMg00860-like [Primulina eburnea]|uniref:uncharacterized mitochondrial protein AtMg00860-like n=1 Tax=Primulina eburnea TaxID=1245227 RepID=UPI003C6C4F7D